MNKYKLYVLEKILLYKIYLQNIHRTFVLSHFITKRSTGVFFSASEPTRYALF